jgi:hypothetical protein
MGLESPPAVEAPWSLLGPLGVDRQRGEDHLLQLLRGAVPSSGVWSLGGASGRSQTPPLSTPLLKSLFNNILTRDWA